MRSSILTLLLTLAPWCQGQMRMNGSTLTASGQLDAAVSQVAASYFPSSIQPSLAVALANAGVTGDFKVLVSSLITQAAPPPYITASALAPFTSRIQKAGSMISSLQQAVYNATHIVPSSTKSANGTIATETAANGTTFVTTIPANGSSMATGAAGGSMTSQPASTAGGSGSSSSSTALAMATGVPVVAAGIIGLLGAIVAL